MALELFDAVDCPNVGLLFDCYYRYTSHGTFAELDELAVYVHINDAGAGVTVDEQLDDVRQLPGSTGVIDVNGFLRALARIAYDGPVGVEPFDRWLASHSTRARAS